LVRREARTEISARRRNPRWGWIKVAVIAITLVLGSATAFADMSKKVIATFKGQILVTESPLQMSGTDKATIAEFKKARLKEIKGEKNSEDAHAWHFVYNAFLSKTGSTDLKLEFYDGGKYVADQRLTDVDPKDPVLQGDISITEDDGLTKGKTYTIKLVAVKGSKETVISTTPLTMN
jgi:hypothetical protein